MLTWAWPSSRTTCSRPPMATTVFHFGTLRIADVKESLAGVGYQVR